MAWKWLERLTAASPGDARAAALYGEVVDIARRPEWYTLGGAADDIDGRFDMVVLVLSLFLVRLERDEADERARVMSSALIERFVADMDGSFREIGIGDMVISKHIGRSMQALGGRLGSYRAALSDDAAPDALGEALGRNLYRGDTADSAQAAWTQCAVRAEWESLSARPLEDLVR